MRDLFGALDWVGVDKPTADRAGDLARIYRRSHHTLDVTDYVIAATAEELAAPLWTRNTKHFPMFPALAAPY